MGLVGGTKPPSEQVCNVMEKEATLLDSPNRLVSPNWRHFRTWNKLQAEASISKRLRGETTFQDLYNASGGCESLGRWRPD
jgi:hypothetical protein